MTGQGIIRKVRFMWTKARCFALRATRWLITFESFVVDKHLEAASHKRNAERKNGGKKQTLKIVLNCKTVTQVENVRICHEWIKVCTTANIIPLHKLDNPLKREFLQSRVVNGGPSFYYCR